MCPVGIVHRTTQYVSLQYAIFIQISSSLKLFTRDTFQYPDFKSISICFLQAFLYNCRVFYGFTMKVPMSSEVQANTQEAHEMTIHIPTIQGESISGLSVAGIPISNTVFSMWIFMAILFTVVGFLFAAIKTRAFPRLRNV